MRSRRRCIVVVVVIDDVHVTIERSARIIVSAEFTLFVRFGVFVKISLEFCGCLFVDRCRRRSDLLVLLLLLVGNDLKNEQDHEADENAQPDKKFCRHDRSGRR